MRVILKTLAFVGLIFLSISTYSNDICNCKGYAGIGGACYAGIGGPAYDGIGGPAYNGVGGPAYDGVGGPCYAGVGGPCYSGIGGTGVRCPKVCKQLKPNLQQLSAMSQTTKTVIDIIIGAIK